MEKCRRSERIISALRWLVMAAGIAACHEYVPLWRVGVLAGIVIAYNGYAVWCLSDQTRFMRQGRRMAAVVRVFDLAVITMLVGQIGTSAVPVYMLYCFVLISAALVGADTGRLALIAAAVLAANAVSTFYALRSAGSTSAMLGAIGLRSAAIAFGFLVSAYLGNSRSRDDLVAERGSYLNAILKCGTQLTSCANVQELGLYVLRTIVAEIRASGAELLLVNDESHELECEASYSSDARGAEGISAEVPVQSYARWVMSSGRDFLVHVGGKASEEAEPTQQDRSVIATPLLWQTSSGSESESKVLGVLVVWGFVGEDFHEDAVDIVRILAAISCAAIVNLRLYTNMQQAFLSTLQSLAKGLEARDEYTRGHSDRVMRVACLIAESLSVPAESLEALRNASLLHDIGKIGVPDAILRKAGKLTSEEWESMRRHPVVSEEICRPLGFAPEILFLIRHHHERLDGKGYPAGLIAQDQPLLQRILVASDSFDAMRSLRPYRHSMEMEDIRVELHRSAGRTMDPTVVDALMKLMDSEEFDAIYQEHDRMTNYLAPETDMPEKKAA